jgi:chromatin remodeling complex protein RSC6
MENDLETQFESIISNISTFKMQLSSLQQDIRNLEKGIKKQMKVLKKESEKHKTNGKKEPSGFAKPTTISNELCKFLNKEEGTKIARTDVAKALTQYIKMNNLQFIDNKQIIIPDENLKKLLGITEQDNANITFFNIQKYMNKHFLTNTTI